MGTSIYDDVQEELVSELGDSLSTTLQDFNQRELQSEEKKERDLHDNNNADNEQGNECASKPKGDHHPVGQHEEEFKFTDPRSRWFELVQFADKEIEKRINNLRYLSRIYTIKSDFAEEVASTLIKEESK